MKKQTLIFFCMLAISGSVLSQTMNNVRLEYFCPCQIKLTYNLSSQTDIILYYTSDTTSIWLPADTFKARGAGINIVDIWDCSNSTVTYGDVYFKLKTVQKSPLCVLINGVYWATRNVNTPGIFALNPEDAGMYYQWDKNIGWSAANPLTSSPTFQTWAPFVSPNTTWLPINDPSPPGYRLPDTTEAKSLMNTAYVSRVNTTLNGKRGALFTDIATGDSIFFPAPGFRLTSDGNLELPNVSSSYWTSIPYNSTAAYDFEIYIYNTGTRLSWSNKAYGYNVRPVLASNTSLLYDSVIIKLTLNPVYDTTYLSDTIFVGTNYTQNGFTIPAQNLETRLSDTLHLQNQYLCDSTVILDLTVICINDTVSIYDSIFVGNDYNKYGFTIPVQNAATTIADTLHLQSQYACDSTVILDLVVKNCTNDTVYLADSIFVGEDYLKNGFTIPVQNEKTMILDTLHLQNQYACDSTVILNLKVISVCVNDTLYITDSICEGETYTENGFNEFESGTYYDTLQNLNGCDSLIILNLSVMEKDTFPIFAAICQGDTYQKNGFNCNESGTYVRELQNCLGCDSLVILDLTVNPIPDIKIVSSSDDFCQQHFIELKAVSNGNSFLWNTGEQTNEITVTQSGVYTATAFIGDCQKTASYTLEDCACIVYIPTGFTPNGDGLNEVFKPIISNAETLQEYKLFIYDRWGNVVFQSFDYAAGWDGNISGKPAQHNTVYSYILIIKDLTNKTFEYTGHITIVR